MNLPKTTLLGVSLVLVSSSLWTTSNAAMISPSVLQDRDAIDRYLRDARTGKPQIRPQAARRLIAKGQEAADRLLELAGESNEDLAALGRDLIEILGEFGDPRLKERLWNAAADLDFPWRPSVVRALTKSVEASETERFVALMQDHLAAVRAAALGALRRLDARDSMPSVQALLSDPDDRVRREAADLIADWGDAKSLWWLLEDLYREDTFFEEPTAFRARIQSSRLLSKRFGGSWNPRLGVDDPTNVPTLERWRSEIQKLSGVEKIDLPVVAKAAKEEAGCVLGVKLRSCRKGEFFLRFKSDDTLLVGLGNAGRLSLPPGSVAKLVDAAKKAVKALEKRDLFGTPGCDAETYYFRGDQKRTVQVSKGPEKVDKLRPVCLGELAKAIVDVIPDELPAGEEDPRLQDLKTRVREALISVGGDL